MCCISTSPTTSGSRSSPFPSRLRTLQAAPSASHAKQLPLPAAPTPNPSSRYRPPSWVRRRAAQSQRATAEPPAPQPLEGLAASAPRPAPGNQEGPVPQRLPVPGPLPAPGPSSPTLSLLNACPVPRRRFFYSSSFRKGGGLPARHPLHACAPSAAGAARLAALALGRGLASGGRDPGPPAWATGAHLPRRTDIRGPRPSLLLPEETSARGLDRRLTTFCSLLREALVRVRSVPFRLLLERHCPLPGDWRARRGDGDAMGGAGRGPLTQAPEVLLGAGVGAEIAQRPAAPAPDQIPRFVYNGFFGRPLFEKKSGIYICNGMFYQSIANNDTTCTGSRVPSPRPGRWPASSGRASSASSPHSSSAAPAPARPSAAPCWKCSRGGGSRP